MRQDRVFKKRASGLSLKLLLLTILFVMVSEVLIYVPSIANFRNTWLRDRLERATIATITLEQTGRSGPLAQARANELLETIGVQAITLIQDGQRRKIIMSDAPGAVTSEFRPGAMEAGSSIFEAFRTLLFGEARTIRVIGAPKNFPIGNTNEMAELEIILSEAELRQAMIGHSVNILQLSLVISIFTAALVYLALRWLLVRPFRRITHNMVRFSQEPENPARVIAATSRSDEIGIAQNQLSHMQEQLQSMLSEKRTLAEIGLAVAKINHDLRNLLASAVLFSDRLGAIEDPAVQRFAPKLLHTLDRAIDYCQSTLSYGKAREAPPAIRVVQLHTLIADVANSMGLEGQKSLIWENKVPLDFTVEADPDQLFRVILNLFRNSLEAMAPHLKQGHADRSVINSLKVCAAYEENWAAITVADTGPGVPKARKEDLFKPFRSKSGPCGTGLGLAIAAELISAHKGILTLDDTRQGASFTIRLPRLRQSAAKQSRIGQGKSPPTTP